MKTSALLIDGSNVYATVTKLGFSIDYKKLIDSFEGSNLLKAYYFTAMRPQEEQSTIRPMVDYLEYNGWTVHQKVTREFRDEDTGIIKIKGNMDIEIAVIAMEIAPHISDLYLFSGDGDFRFLVESLQRRFGVRVHVVSSIKTTPSMCADTLRRQADSFVELDDLRGTVARSTSRYTGGK